MKLGSATACPAATRRSQLIHQLSQFIGSRSRKVDLGLEASPHCAVQQLWVIRRRDEQATGRPFIELLLQDRHKPLQLSHICGVVSTFCQGIKLIQKQHAVRMKRIRHGWFEICACSTEVTAHHPAKV